MEGLSVYWFFLFLLPLLEESRTLCPFTPQQRSEPELSKVLMS